MSDVFAELREASPEIGAALDQVVGAFMRQEISKQEYEYLLTELRDVQAAQTLAGNENAMRLVVAAVSLAATAMG
jgi:hypothetical protein